MSLQEVRGTARQKRFSDEPLFDSQIQTTDSSSVLAANEVQFFQRTFGQPSTAVFATLAGVTTGINANQTDTNLQGTGGVIPNGRQFIALEIGVRVWYPIGGVTGVQQGRLSTAHEDVCAILQGTDLFYHSPVEEQLLGSPWEWPTAGGPDVSFQSVAAGPAFGITNNGQPTVTASRKLFKKLNLIGGMDFRFSLFVRRNITLNQASTAFLLQVNLRGIWIKPGA